MIRSHPARRMVGFGVALLLVVAACGDDAADPERFCEINDELEQLGDPFEVDPDEARDVVRQGRLLLDEAVKVAPDELRDSVEVAADSFGVFLDLAESANFDASQLEDADFEAAFSDEAIAAAQALEEWLDANCSA